MSQHQATTTRAPIGLRPQLPRAGLYVRVSKANGTQTVDNQLLKLRALAQARGLEAVVFEDQRSAVKQRAGFDALIVTTDVPEIHFHRERARPR